MTIEESKKKCYVIMPFSQSSPEHTEEYWNNHFNNFLKPLIESAAPLEAYRSYPLRSDIVEQIVKDLITAPIVVADLTDANPNVYWELGVRQSFTYGTITIAQQGTELPSDIGPKGTLYYVSKQSTGYTENVDFVTHFTEALKDCLSNPESPDSVVLRTITGRATLYQIVKKNENLRKLTALQEENKFNLDLLGIVKRNCDENFGLRAQNKEKECHVITARMRRVCLENLLVNRYIDADDSFYERAQEYFDFATAFSEQLSLWPSRGSHTEEWLLENSPDLKSRIKKFNALVETESKRISSIL
jgi:hypothetical protein